MIFYICDHAKTPFCPDVECKHKDPHTITPDCGYIECVDNSGVTEQVVCIPYDGKTIILPGIGINYDKRI